MAVARARGGPDGYEDNVRVGRCCGRVGCEIQSLTAAAVRNQLLEFWLVDRHLTAAERGYLGVIDIDAGDAMPTLSEARCRNQSHVARTEYHNPHFHVLLTVDSRGRAGRALEAVDLVREP